MITLCLTSADNCNRK